MTALKREATIRWLGHPPDNAPRLSVGSHSIAPLLSLNVDPEARDPLATLPGELLAGAIGSVFTWLVAEQLVNEGARARELVSYVMLTVSGEAADATDAALSAITCRMSGRVAGVEETQLGMVAQAAMIQCLERLGHAHRGHRCHGRGFARGEQVEGPGRVLRRSRSASRPPPILVRLGPRASVNQELSYSCVGRAPVVRGPSGQASPSPWRGRQRRVT
jgi:hypothetical protein